jgi:hypothetical protein
VKCYLIQRVRDGLLLTCEALVKGQVVKSVPAGPFDAGNASKETKALAVAILTHYYGGGQAEAQRRAEPFMYAFLMHHAMPPGARLEISSETIDRWIALLEVPVSTG